MMKNQEAIEILLNEQKCLDRNDGVQCDRKCESCDLVMDAETIREAYSMAISALQAQDIPGTNVGGTVSRQAAIDALMDEFKRVPTTAIRAKNRIDRLPSAQPERKTGRWLIRKGISNAQCSECKMYFSDVYDVENSDAFCRHCGAKMEGLKVVKRG